MCGLRPAPSSRTRVHAVALREHAQIIVIHCSSFHQLVHLHHCSAFHELLHLHTSCADNPTQNCSMCKTAAQTRHGAHCIAPVLAGRHWTETAQTHGRTQHATKPCDGRTSRLGHTRFNSLGRCRDTHDTSQGAQLQLGCKACP